MSSRRKNSKLKDKSVNITPSQGEKRKRVKKISRPSENLCTQWGLPQKCKGKPTYENHIIYHINRMKRPHDNLNYEEHKVIKSNTIV